MASPSAVPGFGTAQFDGRGSGGRTRMMSVKSGKSLGSIKPLKLFCSVVRPCLITCSGAIVSEFG